jgi:3-deoxy-manno-octulosonate cytidylyltransferase (CMP-KDO synthetase)
MSDPSDLTGSPIVVIPARMAATRLPDKPLADIGGAPMIVQVWRRARAAGIGPVLVACDAEAIAEAVHAAGGQAVVTDPDLPSGSDRVAAALARHDPDGAHDVVVNLQGDLPTIDPASLRAALRPLRRPAVDIATIAAPIRTPQARHDPNVVKVAAPFDPHEPEAVARALYFSRCAIPWDGGDASQLLFHHIGVYAYRRAALMRFVDLPPGQLEQRERLEQLRALEAGMRIDVARVDTVPLGVDTPADLKQARRLLADG